LKRSGIRADPLDARHLNFSGIILASHIKGMRRHLTIILQLLFWSSVFVLPCVAQESPPSKLNPQIYDPYLGSYRLASNDLIVIGRTERRLYSYEPRTRRVRGLNPLSETSFTAGPSLLVFSPTEFQITFVKDGKGEVSSLILKEANGPERTASKAGLYSEEKVTFRNGDVTLAGTLLNPRAKGPHPAVVMLHGSGAQDRNGYLSVMRFAADHFARHGIAALIYDKRGVGASKGNWATATFDDMASDAVAALRLLQRRKDIKPDQVGMWGSSQAGWVMAKATSLSKEIAFIISVSAGGSGYTPAQQNSYNLETEMRANGFKQDEINQALTALNLFYDVVRKGEGGNGEKLDTAVRQAQQNVRLKDWLPPLSSEIDWKKRDQWFLALDIDFDPVPLWGKYDGPVLGIFGELDASTPVRQVMPIFERALASRRNKSYAIKLFPKAHHLLLEAETGSDSELERLQRYVPGYFDAMTDWLVQRLKMKR
jgi:pimeloyl-ACP methyl ester carboxylesterase